MIPARATESQTAHLKSATVLKGWLEPLGRMTIFFARIAEAVRMDGIFFRTDSPSRAHGRKFFSHE